MSHWQESHPLWTHVSLPTPAAEACVHQLITEITQTYANQPDNLQPEDVQYHSRRSVKEGLRTEQAELPSLARWSYGFRSGSTTLFTEVFTIRILLSHRADLGLLRQSDLLDGTKRQLQPGSQSPIFFNRNKRTDIHYLSPWNVDYWNFRCLSRTTSSSRRVQASRTVN